MTGLLLKDFLYLRQQGKFFLLLIAFYTVFFSLSQGGEGISGFVSAFVVLMSVMFVINSFAYDELAKWDRFAFSLPVTKKQTVFSKYLFALILAACASAFALLATVAAGRGSSKANAWATIYASFGCSVLLCSILMPLIYRFGLQKARIAMVFLFLAPTLLALVAQKLNPSFFSGSGPNEAQILFWLKLSPVLLIAVFGGSFLISCGIMEKKEV